MIETYKNRNISVGYQCFCTKPSEQGSFFWAQRVVKMSPNSGMLVVCYDQNLQKHKYLSRISMFLHETFRTGLIFPSWLKWVQIVVCYDQNLQKHKYLSGISMFLHETFRTGLIFPSWLKWVQIVVCYDWTYKNINISVGYQCFCTKPSEQGSFFWASWNESK